MKNRRSLRNVPDPYTVLLSNQIPAEGASSRPSPRGEVVDGEEDVQRDHGGAVPTQPLGVPLAGALGRPSMINLFGLWVESDFRVAEEIFGFVSPATYSSAASLDPSGAQGLQAMSIARYGELLPVL